MMEEQHVRAAIQALVERNKKRVRELEAENKTELRASKHLEREIDIVKIDHANMTLIELEHNLRLCGCPDEAYQAKQSS